MYKLIKFAQRKLFHPPMYWKITKKCFGLDVRNLLKANLDKLARVSMHETDLRVGAARHDEWLVEGKLKKWNQNNKKKLLKTN